MAPKRKANIPPNAASANNYTDSAGDAANKRSRISKPHAKAFTNGAAVEEEKRLENKNGIQVENAKAEKTQFDHSRPEEEAGIVDRRFYPAEMSNERCTMYNANEIPRPIEILERTLEATMKEREAIRLGKNGGSGKAVVHWFKRDLRVRDNTALSQAAALAKGKGIGVIGIWIMSPQDWEAHLVSPAKCDLELRSVELLRSELDELDIPLYIETIEKRKALPSRLVELTKKWDVKNVFCNLEYEPDELRREEKLVRLMLQQSINFSPQHDDCVVPPGSLKTGGGKQYAVYTPWFRSWVAHPHLLTERPIPTKNPTNFRSEFGALFSSTLPSLPESKSLADEEKDRFQHMWPAGEAAAFDRLERFAAEKIRQYSATRNFPSKNSTGRVSAHLAAGTLAARTCVRMARDKNSANRLDGGIEGIKVWISEVAWRDFYRHVLVHWPYVWYVLNDSPCADTILFLKLTKLSMNKPFKFEYTNVEWEYNDDHFRAWTEGRTGYPIVDAAMRSLRETAYSKSIFVLKCNCIWETLLIHFDSAQPTPDDRRLLLSKASIT